MKQKWIIFLLVGVLLNLVYLPTVAAQSRTNRLNNVRRKYELKKKFAEEVVSLYGNSAARAELKKARVFEHQARNSFQARNRKKFTEMFEKAHVHLDQAIQITLSQSGGRPFKKLNQKLREAETRVNNCQNQQAKELLRKAQQNEKRSRLFVSQAKYRQAFDLIRIADSQAERAIELCQGRERDNRGEVLDEKERYERLLKKAEYAVEEYQSEKVRSLLAQARNEGDKGDRALKRGHYSRALEFYYNASRLLWRVIEFSDRRDGDVRDNGYLRIEGDLELLENSLTQLEVDLDGASSDEAVRFWEKAGLLRDEAEIALDQNNYQIAEKKIELARKAIQLAYSHVNDSGIGMDERGGKRDFQRLNEKIRQVRKDYQGTLTYETVELLKRAEQFLKLARQDYSNNGELSEIWYSQARQLVVWTELSLNDEMKTMSRKRIIQEIEAFAGDSNSWQLEKNGVTLQREASELNRIAQSELRVKNMLLAQCAAITANRLMEAAYYFTKP